MKHETQNNNNKNEFAYDAYVIKKGEENLLNADFPLRKLLFMLFPHRFCKCHDITF